MLFTCDICGKAYVTRHGLRAHIVKYHEALTAHAPELPLPDHALLELFTQAVFTNDVAGILSDPLVLSYLGTTCTLCSKTFKTRSVLHRHLRHHHATLWKETESQAIDMNQQFRQFGTCYCDPEPQRTQHTCTIFLQYCMLRQRPRPDAGRHGYAPGLAGDALPLGPCAAATPQQHAAALLFHGQVDQIYSRTAMRLHLTIHCMFCSCSFRSGDELMTHARAEHQTLWRDSEATFQYFRKLFFARAGCLCNPGCMPGDDNHQCSALKQLAMIFTDFGMPICVPYAFKAQDLMDLLYPLLTFQGLKEVTVHLMLRQFAKLWQHRELHQLLRSTCLICQETLQINQIVAHMEVAHEMPLRRYQYHLHQLARIFVGLQSDDWACDFCGAHLQIDMVDFGFAARAFEHLVQCPLMLQMAILFGHPIWEYPWPEVVTWPDQATLMEQHRLRDLKLWQLTAPISAHPAFEYLMIANCGKGYLDDPIIAELLNHQCLLCRKIFFSPWKFQHHLFDEHNYHQMDTELCHSLLEFLTRACPCPYCGSHSHAHNVGKRCVALFNLSTFLCNSYGLVRGRGYGDPTDHRDLAAPSHPRGIVANRQGQTRAEPRIHSQTATHQRTRQRNDPRPDFHGSRSADPPGSPTRRRDQCSIDRISVPDSLQPGTGLHCERHGDGIGQVATTSNEAHVTTPPLGPPHADDSPRTTDETGLSSSNRPDSSRLSEIPSGRCSRSNAVLAMVPHREVLGAVEGPDTEHRRSSPRRSEHHATDGRSSSHSSLPFPSESGRYSGQGSTMALDNLQQDQSRTLARNQDAVLSRFLATYHGSGQTTIDAAVTNGPETDERPVKHSLRLLLNLTNTMCFANAALLGLAWVTLLCDGLSASCWRLGASLMRLMTTWTPVPLDLRQTEAFSVLLDGDTWGLQDINKQQDLLDFLCYLMPLMQPSFVHCGWVTRPALLADVSDLRLRDEKGHRFQPLRLHLDDQTQTEITIQNLVQQWHDSLGLCRAFEEASQCKCIAIDRVHTQTNIKCEIAISLANGHIWLPIFQPNGDIEYHDYCIHAVSYHIGTTTQQGHYRCAIWNNSVWYIYDDGKLPDQFNDLPTFVLTQICLIWLVRTPDRIQTDDGRSVTLASEDT